MMHPAMIPFGFLLALACAGDAAAMSDGGHLQPEPIRVYLRGDPEPIPATQIEVLKMGVRFASPSGPRVVSWSEVRTITGDLSESERDVIDAYSDRVWRAMARYRRGDIVLAEPLLESLFEQYASISGPTAVEICEALTRIRLARGARTSAIAPWLCWMTAAAPPARASPDGDMAPGSAAVAGETKLLPSLPPVFVRAAGVERLARRGVELPPATGALDGPARELAEWYQAAAVQAVGLEPSYPPRPSDPDAGLVADIVLAVATGATERSEARDRLGAVVVSHGGSWREAWARLGIGRSLVREPVRERQLLGVIELAHLPARFAVTHPELAWIALGEISAAMRRLGEPSAAEAFVQEMRGLFPSREIELPTDPAWLLPPQPQRPEGSADIAGRPDPRTIPDE